MNLLHRELYRRAFNLRLNSSFEQGSRILVNFTFGFLASLNSFLSSTLFFLFFFVFVRTWHESSSLSIPQIKMVFRWVEVFNCITYFIWEKRNKMVHEKALPNPVADRWCIMLGICFNVTRILYLWVGSIT